MKKTIVILSICLSAIGCGPDYKSEVEKLKNEKDSILVEFSLRDSVINSYMRDVSDIQSEIQQLTQQEGVLKKEVIGNELSRSQREKMLDDIAALRNIIDSGKKKLANLQSKLRKSERKIDELENMIVNLNEQITLRDSSIQDLTIQVAALNGKIAQLDTAMNLAKADNEQKRSEIADKTQRLNTAYFVVGDYKKLKTQNVLSQEGKFFGIAKNKTVNSDFNQAAFTKIDITNTVVIDVISTKAELLSTHPTGSYSFIRQNDKIMGIEITDPDKFWQASKYLVIATN